MGEGKSIRLVPRYEWRGHCIKGYGLECLHSSYLKSFSYIAFVAGARRLWAKERTPTTSKRLLGRLSFSRQLINALHEQKSRFTSTLFRCKRGARKLKSQISAKHGKYLTCILV